MRSRRVRGGRRSALALVTVVALVVSVALGGRPYFFCPQMNEASFHACCARAAMHAQSAAIDDDACCSGRRLGTPDPGVVAQPSAPSLNAPLAALVPAAAPWLAPRLSLVRRFAHEARAGPGDAREHRLRSMVFLT